MVAKYTQEGKIKKGSQQGDLDLVGLGPGPDYRLLVAECKGFGGPVSYENWFTAGYLCYLADLVWNLSNNIKSVTHSRWGDEFEKRRDEQGICKPDEVWIVFPGNFFPKSNLQGLKYDDPDYGPLIKEISKIAQPIWNSWEDEKRSEYEKLLLQKVENILGNRYDVHVRLLPIHHLLRYLLVGVTKDMIRRRKRYPDTAMEMIRWIARTVSWQTLDLAKIQTEMQEILDNERG